MMQKSYESNLMPIHVKTLRKIDIQVGIFNSMKNIFKKPSANIILKTEYSPLNNSNKDICSLSPFFQHSAGSSS